MRYIVVEVPYDMKKWTCYNAYDALKDAQAFVEAKKYARPDLRYFIYHCVYECQIDKPSYKYRPLDEPSPEIG